MTMLNGEPINTPNISTASVTSQPVPGTETPLDGAGRIMGFMALIFAFAFPIAGAILGGIAMSQARRVGAKNPLATAGFWIGLALTIIVIVVAVVIIVLSVGVFTSVFEICDQLGPGIHEYNGVTYECNI